LNREIEHRVVVLNGRRGIFTGKSVGTREVRQRNADDSQTKSKLAILSKGREALRDAG